MKNHSLALLIAAATMTSLLPASTTAAVDTLESSQGPYHQAAMKLVMETTARRMPVPASTEFRAVLFASRSGGGGYVCGEVRSKLRSGGEPGPYMRFLGREQGSGMEPGVMVEEGQPDFARLWTAFCR